MIGLGCGRFRVVVLDALRAFVTGLLRVGVRELWVECPVWGESTVVGGVREIARWPPRRSLMTRGFLFSVAPPYLVPRDP